MTPKGTPRPDRDEHSGGITRSAQARAWANKVAQGFNTTSVPMEFGLLYEEVGEAFSAWRKGQPGLGQELADVAIFLLGLAQMTGIDLAAEVEAKLAVNETRTYARLPSGALVKQEPGAGVGHEPEAGS